MNKIFKRIVNRNSNFNKLFTGDRFFEKLQLLKESFRQKIKIKFYLLFKFISKKEIDLKSLNILKFIPFSICTGLILLNNKTEENTLLCFKASNKELEKVLNNLETQIKNLEFKYHGKMRRQAIK